MKDNIITINGNTVNLAEVPARAALDPNVIPYIQNVVNINGQDMFMLSFSDLCDLYNIGYINGVQVERDRKQESSSEKKAQ